MKEEIEFSILKSLREASQPLSTRELALGLKVAWHTVDRHCLKLQLQNKISSFTIGKSTAWYIKK